MPICFVTHGERGVKYNDIQLVIDIVHLLSRYENLLSRDSRLFRFASDHCR